MAVSEQKILKLFYRWSSQTGATLDNENDLHCLYDLERFVGAHLNKRSDAKTKKNKCAESAALKRVEIAANRHALEAAAMPSSADDGQWSKLTQAQLDEIAREKDIINRIYRLQLKQDRLMKQ
ncbi:hypothetical protein chmu147 [Choristoneura murinana nucleopolyhedrovirus]|uniref:Uncharacterized protein n=1 Tax=Choristoneura murinana nucleopolyhedrovirus TaxID=1987479 RepID=V9XQ25_9ABAC|nr:hypothetical protein chmu147 [Choristoneura murinana nucleopolyhedrovirus]AHD25632.1 hypothetical protein chmu147 [Choristoneura murinana nucleopolyhedrovirus]